MIICERVFPPAVGFLWAAALGLRNSDSPTSDNLTQQETTNQTAPDMGLDGPSLSCPGSGVVADEIDDEVIKSVERYMN